MHNFVESDLRDLLVRALRGETIDQAIVVKLIENQWDENDRRVECEGHEREIGQLESRLREEKTTADERYRKLVDIQRAARSLVTRLTVACASCGKPATKEFLVDTDAGARKFRPVCDACAASAQNPYADVVDIDHGFELRALAHLLPEEAKAKAPEIDVSMLTARP